MNYFHTTFLLLSHYFKSLPFFEGKAVGVALSANSSSIPMVLTLILYLHLPFYYMAFSSSHPVLIQKPRRSPLRRGKPLLSVIAVNTLCL